MTALSDAFNEMCGVCRPRRDQDEEMIEPAVRRLWKVLGEYGENVAIEALNEWPKKNEFFPTEKELRELLDYIRINSDKATGKPDTKGRRDAPWGLTKYFYERVAKVKGEAYARSWLRGGLTCMFTERYVYVNQVGHDRLWRDLEPIIRECGVAIVVDDDIAKLLVDYIERNNIGSYEPKRRRA